MTMEATPSKTGDNDQAVIKVSVELCTPVTSPHDQAINTAAIKSP